MRPESVASALSNDGAHLGEQHRELAQHADILRSLAGEDERELAAAGNQRRFIEEAARRQRRVRRSRWAANAAIRSATFSFVPATKAAVRPDFGAFCAKV